MDQVLTEIKNERIASSKQKGIQLEEIRQEPRLDEIEKLLKNLEINPNKFNGPLQRPKTASKAFGSILDYTLFFENRNPEMKQFAQEFKKIETMNLDSSMIELRRMIIPKINECLNKMYERIKATRPLESQDRYKNKYADLFQRELKTWEDFYKQIFHAYTISSFLFRTMNELLRNEDWMELDALLPYTYCLLKAFLWGSTDMRAKENFQALKAKSKDNKLVLYRGASFDDESLEFYERTKLKNFSWNGVISTSLLKCITMKFKRDPSKRPVLIIIEIDFEDLEPESLNALYLATFSAFQKEEEVALPPGSIFELLEIDKKSHEVIMQLKLVTNVKLLANRGQFLHGMLQSIMRSEDELNIVYLKEKELSRAIKHCKGNQLIRNLEFCVCTFNEKAIKVFKDVIPTIKRLSSLTLNTSLFEEGCRIDEMLKCLENTEVKNIQIFATLIKRKHIEGMIKGVEYLRSIEYLKVSFEEKCEMSAPLLQDLFNESCQFLNSGCILDVDLGTCYHIMTKVSNLENLEKFAMKALIKNWPVGFGFPPEEFGEIGCQEQKTIEKKDERKDENDKGFKVKDEIENIEIIESVTGTRRYCLEKEGCQELIEEETLVEVLDRYLFESEKSQHEEKIKDLQSKNLFWSQDFQRVRQIESLTSLQISFGEFRITDQEISLLCSQGLQKLQSLKTLDLVFSLRNDISDEGVRILCSEGIRFLQKLESLHLNFFLCEKITDEGIKNISSQGMQYLPDLTSLRLIFGGCSFTDQGTKSLCFGLKKYLSELTSLYLDFGCLFTDQGMKTLFSEGIRYLKKLTSLYLNFSGCGNITDQSLEIICSKGILNLQELTSLHLDISCCLQIRNQGLKMLVSEGIRHLVSLINLHLQFDYKNDVEQSQLLSFFQSMNFKFSSVRNSLIMSLPSANYQLPSLGKELQFTQNSVSAKYEEKHGFYFQKNFLQSKTTIPKLVATYSPSNSQDNHIETHHSDFEKTRRKYHVSFQLDLDYTHVNQNLTDQNDKIAQWKDAEILSLMFKNNLSLNWDKFKGFYSQTIKCFESITILHLCSDVAKFPLCEVLQILVCVGIQDLQLLKSLNLIFPNVQIDERVKKETYQSLKSVSLSLLTARKIEMKEEKLFLRKRFPKAPLTCSERLQENNKTQIARLMLRNCVESESRFYPLKEPNQNLFQKGLNYGKSSIEDGENYQSLLPKRSDLPFEIVDLDLSTQQNLENLQVNFKEFQKFRSLLELSLNFAGRSDITNEALQSIFEGIKSLKLLNTLKLNFCGCQRISDYGLQSIDFQELQLTELSLKFGLCYHITDDGVDYLSRQGIKYIDLLTKLELNFDSCQHITQKGLRKLGRKIARNLNLLTDLKLSFNNCTEITDIGFEWPSETQKLKSLTTLSLSFSECFRHSDEDIIKITSGGIRFMQSLKTLHLSFGGKQPSYIRNNGIQYLCREGISHLKSLASLYLNFNIREGLSDEGLESICCEAIQHLEGLKTLGLIFQGDNRITEKGIERIVFKGMSRLVLIEDLQLGLTQVFTTSSLYELFVKIMKYFGVKKMESLEF